MTEDADPEANLREWKEAMRAEHDDAIENPAPDERHRIEGVAQVSYRVYFEYDEESDALSRTRREQVEDFSDPELLSCACGVRGMTPEEARRHVRAAREARDGE
ncbi:hypothetical protein [Haloarcula nitratireducens]|uniref:PH domain-containing protein n=1 Tax=Haloarcula nitratireducens TaxID=2487749 RepID=A0AAW4P9F4_9EURY|nr:hypothetical protein [Halomicroarcula nitratireducens]MBX0293922.1 hypothetical protein [Halomicroarcula nitratireducens]